MSLTLASPFRQIPLVRFGGLYTETDPKSLPEGLSPLVHDCDFKVGEVAIRPGLKNIIQFGNSKSSGYAGLCTQRNLIVDGQPWVSPTNAEGAPDGHYATVETGMPGGATGIATQVGLGSGWTDPENLVSPTLYASKFLPSHAFSNPIVAYNFPLSEAIPSGAEINYIAVYMEELSTYAGAGLSAQLGTFDGATFTPIGSQLGVTLGSSGLVSITGDWGAYPTPAQANSSAFAVQISVGTGVAATISLRNVYVVISYGLAATSSVLLGSNYGFAIPAGTSIGGIGITVTGLQTTGALQLWLWDGSNFLGTVQNFSLPSSVGTVTLGGPTYNWDTGLPNTLINSPNFGWAIVAAGGSFSIDAVLITVYLTPAMSPGFNWLRSFNCPGKGQLTLALDTAGTLWQENVDSTPGVMNSIYVNLAPLGKVLAATTAARCYMTFSDLINALDMPRQYDGTYLDRISQVGPGVGPTITTVNTSYAINPSPTGLYQPYAAVTAHAYYWGNAPTDYTNIAGTTLTLEGSANQTNFNTGVNVGDTIYISGLGTIGGVDPDGVYAVIAVGSRTGAAGLYQYVTVAVTKSQNFGGSTTATFQKTVALVSLADPIPNGLAQVGSQLTIASADDASWDGTYTIIGTPGQGQLLISATSLTSGVATYTYSVISGASPGWQAGEVVVLGQLLVAPDGTVWQVTTQGTTGAIIPSFGSSPQSDNTAVWTQRSGASMLVTVFNTDNGAGIFNVANAVITSANQTTFTVAIDQPNVPSAAEEGNAFSGSGNLFEIDPGLQYIGTDSDPIYSASGGGTVVAPGSITPGQRYGILMYLTRNGYMTPASPPIPFYTSESSVGLQFNNLPIGPPNVIARIVAITPAEAGIGGPYYWIPEDVTVNDLSTGLSTTYNKTIIQDNETQTSGLINFSDTVLLASENVTEQGNNALQKRELGSCAGILAFSSRMFYFGEQTKVDNLVNLTFDGGYQTVSATNPTIGGPPAGWEVDGSLIPMLSLPPSPIFGNSLYIKNSTGFTYGGGNLTQFAYQDAFNAPIIVPNTAYSARVTARIPSGNKSGSLLVSFISPSQGTWDITIPFASLSDSFSQLILPFNNPLWQAVPPDLRLRVGVNAIGNNNDVEIDRIELFPTNYPAYTTQMAASYVDDFESIDGVTGIVDASQSNSQPIRTAYVLFDTLYVQKTASAVSTQDNGSTEPAGWEVKPVTLAVGALGGLAADAINTEEEGTGEDYALVASRKGVYLFNGGNHIKMSQEIQSIWNSLYAPSLQTVWIKNDVQNKRILVGVPLPTPNQWLPLAPTNSSPSQPNVCLAMSYLGLDTPEELASEAPAHTSAFTGALLARDLVRKWNIWQIPTQATDWIERADGSLQQWIGGVSGTGKIYQLLAGQLNDDGMAIPETYMTYGFSDPQNEQGMQLGSIRKIFPYATATLEGAGGCIISAYPEDPKTPYVDTFPAFPLSSPALDDVNVPLNETGNRCFFELTTDGLVGSWFALRRMVMGVMQDPSIPISGR